MMGARFPVFPLFVCFLAFLVLCGLGVWQLQRLQWKTELQHKIDVLMAEPDVPQLSAADFQLQGRNDLRRGLVFARFFLSQAVYLNGYLEDGVTRYPVIVPARLENGGQNFVAILWVDRKKRSKEWAGKDDLDWAMTGMTRLPDLSVFRPKNNPDQEEWWQIDVQQLADFWGISGIAPAVFYAGNPPIVDEDLSVYDFPTRLRNDHLQYALFWFSLAGVLLILTYLRFVRPYLHSA